jgi:hypothetical protein
VARVIRRDLAHHPFVGLFVGAEAIDPSRDEATAPQLVDSPLQDLDVPQDVVALSPFTDLLDAQ